MRTCWGITKQISFCKRPTGGKIYCDQHRSQPKYILITALIGISLSYIAGVLPVPWRKGVVVETSGVLTPDNAPTPPNECDDVPKGTRSPKVVRPGQIIFFIGSSVARQSTFPLTILRLDGKDLLSINKTTKGVSVTAEIYNEKREIVASIKDNRFYVTPSGYHRIERNNNHSLIVYDKFNKKVLDIYYLNPIAIKILGIFNSPSRPTFIIENDKIIYGEMTFVSECFSEGRKAVIDF